MSDRLNDELLSAYLDNEVTAEERAEVERALVESPETRRSLESLKQVQARVQAVPRLSLPADFHQRVVQEAERRAAEEKQVTPSMLVVAGAGLGTSWAGYAAVAATVAAIALVSVMVVINDSGSEIAEKPSQPLPGEEVLVQADARPMPKLIMILDLAITKKGQEQDVFGKALKKAGIDFDPNAKGVVLDKKLRADLLKSRVAAGVNQPAAGKVNERFDIVDMVYIRGTGDQIDKVHQTMVAHQEVRAVLDFAYKPDAMRVLNTIGQRTWSLAGTAPNGRPSSFAYHLNVGLTLHSSRSGFFAKFPTPGVDIRVLETDDKRGLTPGFSFPIPMEFGGNQPVPGDAVDTTTVLQDPIYEILVIRRNLKGGFPKNAQKPDPK